MRKKKTAEEEPRYGSQIKQLRTRLKMTQTEVAEALQVTPGYISNVENNRCAMSLKILIYYARLTGISLDELAGLMDPAYTSDFLDHKLMENLSRLSLEQKEKLLRTIEIWSE
ncbi:MAG: helix-turn-helix transcriptional regulator [Solobacterium sp.]|nr:helix-turn-helix transcriptional regulator [Solobacterium sp.]